jgi:ABC-type branched-subunit amino acid transport system ATPase component
MRVYQQQNQYKSLSGIDIQLPSLTVLTGLNGAGKTQLLKGIAGGHVAIEQDNGVIPRLRYTNSMVRDNRLMYANPEHLVPNEAKTDIDSLIRAGIGLLDDFKKKASVTPNLTIIQQHSISSGLDWAVIITKIAEKLGKQVIDLTNSEVATYWPAYSTSIFNQNLSGIFKKYSDRLDENDYREFRHNKGQTDVEFLSKHEFESAFGTPPWELFNRIISLMGLNYTIDSPINSHREVKYTAALTDKTTNKEIDFSDLSSGERTLMSLVFALYNTNFDIDFPEFLLLDEPDASLHPSMCKQLLDIVETVFVKEKGVNVILTTHSPTTVALSREECLYVMNRSGVRVQKVSKDKALSLLLAGVPSLSVNYENRRQVFVESRVDVALYESFYQNLRPKLNAEVSIDFISSGVGGEGNCDQVREVVNTLSRFGNKTVYGIIDWDLKNNGNDFVKVLGHNQRYSIENYVFDPVVLVAFLIWGKYIDKQAIGLAPEETYLDLKAFDNGRLQHAVDFVVSKIKVKTNSKKEGQIVVGYISGAQVNVPLWYLHFPGHGLENAIKAAFPKLGAHTKPDELKKAVLLVVADDLPGLIPLDILLLFQSIQNLS